MFLSNPNDHIKNSLNRSKTQKRSQMIGKGEREVQRLIDGFLLGYNGRSDIELKIEECLKKEVTDSLEHSLDILDKFIIKTFSLRFIKGYGYFGSKKIFYFKTTSALLSSSPVMKFGNNFDLDNF